MQVWENVRQFLVLPATRYISRAIRDEMSVKRALFGCAVVVAVVVVVCLYFLVSISQRAGQSEEQLARTSEIRRLINVLALTTGQLALEHGEDVHGRWVANVDQIAANLEGLRGLGAEAGVQYERIAENIPVLQQLGSDLSALHTLGMDSPSAEGRVLLRKERLLAQVQAVVADSLGASLAIYGPLQESARRDSSSLRNLFWSVLAILIVMVVSVIVLLWRVVLRPLSKLEAGVSVVGSGDLSHRVRITSTSEIGQLSRAFDSMTGNLQAITVSRDALEAEAVRRVRAEEAQEAVLADLQRSNRDLEQFAYVASHDLQEPLRMVATYTQLLGQRYAGQLDQKADKYIGYAIEGATRMQQLIDDLLTYSRVGTRGKPPENIDARVAVDEALANLAATVEESQAAVRVDDLPCVEADPLQLMQLFQNLIGNSLKFRGENPPSVHISARREDGDWLFSIADNGIGIEMKHSERVFTIFQRLHTRVEYPGSGIGLAVCKRIVERHGGRIWFESKYGSGSTFYFTLPG